MQEVIESLRNPAWWFSAIFIAIIVNLVSNSVGNSVKSFLKNLGDEKTTTLIMAWVVLFIVSTLVCLFAKEDEAFLFVGCLNLLLVFSANETIEKKSFFFTALLIVTNGIALSLPLIFFKGGNGIGSVFLFSIAFTAIMVIIVAIFKAIVAIFKWLF